MGVPVSGIDWAVIIAYLLGMVGLSVWLGRGQSSTDDYYVGGRNLPWWAVGISTMATQSSANSFLGIPAYVALKEGGGLTWLQYELAVPLAMIVVMVVLIPFFRRLELISVYEYLEMRFGRSVRLFLSGVFLISRGLATGVGVYAAAIVLAVCLGIPVWATILLIGIVTIIYDTIGGMAAVVWSDVIQMGVLLLGLVACIYYAADTVGGLAAVMESLPAERWHAFDPGTGLGDGAKAPFWGFLLGGFFLYASYYGVDQSQAQRELSAPTLADTKRSLVFNGLARFPMTILYIVLGIACGAVYAAEPELRAAVDAHGNPDYLVPEYILRMLPEGLRAVLIASILAAAMSSLDSALNSLSAATMRDFVESRTELSGDRLLRLGKIVTVIWGVLITAAAFVAGSGAQTVVEKINALGATFYGPILAAFLMGILSRRSTARGIISGVVAGIAVNLVLKYATPTLFWMWWNLSGLVVSVLVTIVVSRLGPPPPAECLDGTVLSFEGILAEERQWLGTYAILIGYFVVMVVIVLFAHHLAPGSA